MAAYVTSSALVQLGGILCQTRGIAGGAFAKTHWRWCDTAVLKWKQNRGRLLKLGTICRGCAVQRSQQYSRERRQVKCGSVAWVGDTFHATLQLVPTFGTHL